MFFCTIHVGFMENFFLDKKRRDFIDREKRVQMDKNSIKQNILQLVTKEK